MNAHTPFDANKDWSNPYCQNSSNDQIVDSLLGNAYHVVRTVYCNLGNLKLLYDFLNQYGMVIGVQSEAELKALTADAKYARIYGFSRAGDRQVTDYLYVEGDRTGILPDDTTATGSWVTVATSGSNSGGTSSGDGAYIPWVYNKGSAIGGETSINVPDWTVGVPFIIVNGDMQYVGRGFEFNADNLSVTLAQPLEEGDEVVFLLTGVPAVPDNPHVNDWVQINWLYNNGAAVGGEQVIAIPYTFQSVPAVYKNGLRLYKGLTTESYTADPDNQRILLTEPLATNDRLIVQIGGEARVLEASDHTLQEVARAANVKDSEVILSTDTTQVLNGKKIIYDVVSQHIYGLPTIPTNVYIVSVSDGQLTYSPGNITVTLLDSYQQQNTSELWRRSLAEAGLTLVDGSFEEGATANSATDAVWHVAGEQCYMWEGELPKIVSAGSTPETAGGIGLGKWVSVGDASLRNELNTPNGASLVKTSTGESVESRFTANEVILSNNSSAIAQINGANGGAHVGHTSRAGRIRTMDDVVNDIWHINDFIREGETTWENAFNRVASSGVGAVRLSGIDYALWAPVSIASPTKLIGAGRGKTRLIKAHTGGTIDVRHSNFELSDLSFIQDEVVGAGSCHIYLNSLVTPLENIRISNIIQLGGTANFLLDNGGSNLIVDLALNDIKLQGIEAAGIILSKAFAYLDLTKVTVNYVPSSRKDFVGISITGNEGSNFRWCHVNTGITSALPGSYGFAFSNCKAVWMDSCQADTVGVDGFRFDNCQYVYGNKLSASLCGGFGFALNGGSNFMLSDCYAGGRRGLAYDGGAGNMGFNVTATRAFINNSLAVNCAGYGYAASTGSSVMRGGAFANNANNYSLTGANYLRGVMVDSGGLIDAG